MMSAVKFEFHQCFLIVQGSTIYCLQVILLFSFSVQGTAYVKPRVTVGNPGI